MTDHRRSPPDIPRIRGEISSVPEFHINVTRAKYRAQTLKPYNNHVHSWSNTSWLMLVGHHMTYGLWDSLSDSSYTLGIVEIFFTIENGHQCGMGGRNQKPKWISSFPYLLNITGLGFTVWNSVLTTFSPYRWEHCWQPWSSIEMAAIPHSGQKSYELPLTIHTKSILLAW